MYARTIPGLLKSRVQQSPNAVAHWTMDPAGNWRPTTWESYWHKAKQLAAGLQELGLRKHQKIGIMAHTSQIWELIQMAVLISGGVVVGIDPHDRNDNIHQISGCAKLTGMIVESPVLLRKIPKDVTDHLNFVICLDRFTAEERSENLFFPEDLYRIGIRKQDSLRISDDHASPATLIFTSGTTGTPKGIMYTHEQVLAACTSILEVFDNIQAESKLVCWLPLSNLFQRMVNFCAVSSGASTYFVENPREVVKYLSSINPHIFIGVPRFFEKLHQGLMEGVNEKPLWMRKMIAWALKIGDDHARASREQGTVSLSTGIAYKIADAFILKRLRSLMGTNLKHMVSGSAPMPRWLLEWYHALGIVILEAYGISENIIPIAINRPYEYRFGTVGKPLSGNEIVIADDGELLVKGRGVFSGYYNDCSSTESLTPDGYLATGDYAEIDKDGFLSLTGRKSEVFKTSTGRRIAPVGIENCLRRIPYVENAVVFGAGRKSITVFLSISCPVLFERTEVRSTATGGDKPGIPADLYPMVQKDVQKEVVSLPKYQRPVGLILSPHPFTVEGGELTGNLKIRRKAIEQKYREHINRVYAMLEEVKEPLDMVIYSL